MSIGPQALGDNVLRHDGTFTVTLDTSPDGGGDFPTTPLPSALVLFGSGLGTLVLLGRYKKRKAAAVA